MPLDPGIFFQGAALQQANAARTQATMDNLFNRFAAQKQRQQELEQKKATDYEGSAYRVLMAQQAGQQPDPQDLLRAQAWDKMQSTKVAVDPVTGNVYSPRTSLFDNMAAAPSAPYQPQYAPPEAVDIENLAPMLESQLTAPYPSQANVPLPPRGGQGVDMERIAQARIDNQARLGQPAMDMIEAPAPTGNRKLDQAGIENAQKMNMELQRDAIKRQTEPMTVEQGKLATFADRLQQAEKDLGTDLVKASQLSMKERAAGEVPVVGNYLVSSNYQKARQAERNFINAVLRRESGAVISPEEFANARQQYFPQPGDSEDVLTQKAANRQAVIQGFMREAGPAYKPNVPTATKDQGAPVDYTEYFK